MGGTRAAPPTPLKFEGIFVRKTANYFHLTLLSSVEGHLKV